MGKRIALQIVLGFFCLSLIGTPAMAGTCSAKSGTHRVALVELFTSEGCSSCPPADRWLSNLSGQGFTSAQIIPLAWHVDYWDYIGWKDPFAQTAFSDRQHTMSGLSGSTFVYTPQVMLNGRDFRYWANHGDFTRQVGIINQSSAHASLSLSISSSPNSSLDASVSANAESVENAVLNVALYENGLDSDVRAGENSGRQLHHDYVVRKWYGPVAMNETGATPWHQMILLKPGWNPSKIGLVAFVQNSRNGEVLQAVQLGFCK